MSSKLKELGEQPEEILDIYVWLLGYIDHLKKTEPDVFEALEKLEARISEDLEAAKGGWL